VHCPPLQLWEQQSSDPAHASPSVLHAKLPATGRGAQAPFASVRVQHASAEVAGAPVGRHAWSAQTPFTQESEQHSPPEAQPVPLALQNRAGTQVPPSQFSEQQSRSSAHAVGHCTIGRWHFASEPHVAPWQQSAFEAHGPISTGVHPFGSQVCVASLQTSGRQQSPCVVQLWPASLQLPPQTPAPQRRGVGLWQHSFDAVQPCPAATQARTHVRPAGSQTRPVPAQHAVVAQDAPCAAQAGAWQVPFWHVFGEQQVASEVQAAPACALQPVVQTPPAQESPWPAQQLAFDVQAAPAPAHAPWHVPPTQASG
jgi:hypothetical protein